ncbi:Phytocyanin domain containing protein [Parasponia andersonii]|uniref:Phytocyanin domain containing protein n=1 Tax=Parasponia andersonii TaxID=3476 RepID=A0A2P5E3N1_PARAD|nr:Phytocyanin domain containing protein [Parasponia andersonii]
MALVVRALANLVLVAVTLQVSKAAVHKVGDSAGWTTIGNVDYKLWSATKTFQVGDTIKFEYNPQFHNVMRVTHAMFRSCNASLPLETYTTGNDTITITTRGHHFYICGVPGHCQGGQKVDINVPRALTAEVAPTPLASDSPPAPAAKTPAPASNSVASLVKKSHPVLLGLAAVMVFVVFGSSFHA